MGDREERQGRQSNAIGPQNRARVPFYPGPEPDQRGLHAKQAGWWGSALQSSGTLERGQATARRNLSRRTGSIGGQALRWLDPSRTATAPLSLADQGSPGRRAHVPALVRDREAPPPQRHTLAAAGHRGGKIEGGRAWNERDTETMI